MSNATPPPSLPEVLNAVYAKDPRYPVEAYSFLLEALDDSLKAALDKDPQRSKQLSGVELLNGIRDYALDEFGPMAYTVFSEWNLHKTADFGDLVYNLIEAGRLGTSETDRREDFNDVFSFEEAFLKPYEPPLTAAEARAASRKNPNE